MKTYIINLKESGKRRKDVENLLKPYSDILETEFIEAFDGRKLKQKELEKIFNQNAAYSIYGRELIGPEVGCTLSHRRCLQYMLETKEKAALILEDDLTFGDSNISEKFRSYYDFIKNNDRAAILLLSGDYWYTTRFKIQKFEIARVREAVCSHAYFINREAAQIVYNADRCHLADDWYSLSQMGIKIYAAYPHIADQNRRDYETEISDKYVGFIRRNLSPIIRLHSYYRAIIKQLLLKMGHFECKSFIE